MTVEELVRHGADREAAGDLEGAERAYREADELCDAEGAIRLGRVLRDRGDLRGAGDAFQRAEARGHPEAASFLGDLLSDNGDIERAKSAYERSIRAGSTAAILNLGLTLAQAGEVDAALKHLCAAEEVGYPTASWAIGKILEGREDLEGAATAYRRGADGGNAHAAYGLGSVLEKMGDREGAITAFQRARDLGHEGAGKLLEALEEQDKPRTVLDVVEAMTDRQISEPQEGEPRIAPLMEGEERLLQTVHRPDGNRNDIYLIHRRPTDDQVMGTGEPINFVAIIRSTDADPNDTSPQWAWQRGPTERSICIAIAEAFVNAPPPPGTSISLHPDVQWFADRIRENAGPGVSAPEAAARWADLYVEACGEVLTAANACLEVANQAVGARRKIAEHQYDGLPGTPIAIRNFTTWAEQAERGFGPLYETFDDACATARDTAARLLAEGSDPVFAEMQLAMRVEQSVLDNVATAKGILGASYGPTPAGFLQGVDQANQLIQNGPGEGNIYRPPAPVQSVQPNVVPSR